MLRSVYNVNTINYKFLMKCFVNMIATPLIGGYGGERVNLMIVIAAASLVPRLSNYCGGGKESLVSIACACA